MELQSLLQQAVQTSPPGSVSGLVDQWRELSAGARRLLSILRDSLGR
jgi:hypothetical protein